MGVFTDMNLLDLLLLLGAVAYAASGYRRGLVASVILVAGFLGGAVIGVWVLPYALGPFQAGTLTAWVVALAVVLIPAAFGHGLAAQLAWRVRRGLNWAAR